MPDINVYIEMSPTELQGMAYEQTLIVQRLQHEVDELARSDLDALLEREDELLAAEDKLHDIQRALIRAEERVEQAAAAEAKALAESDAIPKALATGKTYRSGRSKPAEKPKDELEFTYRVNMPQAPTAVYHLFSRDKEPLVSCELTNNTKKMLPRNLLVSAYIESYSASAVQMVRLARDETVSVRLLPTLFPERVAQIQTLTRATVHIVVEDIDNDNKIEDHITEPIWLLARTSAPQAVKDPNTGEWNDLTRYLGAYVTPSATDVMGFLRKVVDHHPETRLSGYQKEVWSQAKAIYEALQKDAELSYVDSLFDFNPGQDNRSQRIRLPRESLAQKMANCIDGTVLFASLLEAITVNPCIVLVPRHAFVGWETGQGNGDWQYLETTMLKSHGFEQALEIGNRRAAAYEKRLAATGDQAWFRRWSLRDLRVEHGIMPME